VEAASGERVPAVEREEHADVVALGRARDQPRAQQDRCGIGGGRAAVDDAHDVDLTDRDVVGRAVVAASRDVVDARLRRRITRERRHEDRGQRPAK
jgi:hypothetical protein